MPRPSRRSSASRRRRSTKRVVRRVARPRRSLGRLGKMSDTHHFKGTINAGVLRWISNVNSVNPIPALPTNSGVYVLRLADIPNFTELSNLYEFIRVNRCVMEFLPRFNMTNVPIGTTEGTETTNVRLPTFITGIDEVPLVTSSTTVDLTPSPSWVSQGGDSSTVSEMAAYQAIGVVGPDYIRGLSNSRETEIYKKHVVRFTPAFFDYAVVNQAVAGGQSYPLPGTGVFERKAKKWLNTTYLLQNTSLATSTETVGPDFYGPMYSFSFAATVTSAANTSFELYDVKMRYSISLRRYKGAPGTV